MSPISMNSFEESNYDSTKESFFYILYFRDEGERAENSREESSLKDIGSLEGHIRIVTWTAENVKEPFGTDLLL